MSTLYTKCQNCGCNLDHGEHCECETRHRPGKDNEHVANPQKPAPSDGE